MKKSYSGGNVSNIFMREKVNLSNFSSGTKPFVLLLGENHQDSMSWNFLVDFAFYLVVARNIDPSKILFGIEDRRPEDFQSGPFDAQPLNHSSIRTTQSTNALIDWHNKHPKWPLPSYRRDPFLASRDITITFLSEIGVQESWLDASRLPDDEDSHTDFDFDIRDAAITDGIIKHHKQGKDFILFSVGSNHLFPRKDRPPREHYLHSFLTDAGINSHAYLPVRSTDVEEDRHLAGEYFNYESGSDVHNVKPENLLDLGTGKWYKKNCWNVCDQLYCSITGEKELPKEKLNELSGSREKAFTRYRNSRRQPRPALPVDWETPSTSAQPTPHRDSLSQSKVSGSNPRRL